MEAELIYATPNPLALIWYSYWNAKSGTRFPWPPLAEWSLHDVERQGVLQLLREGWCPALEFPRMVWRFRIPRSLHAQLTKHRRWSFWSESHQLVAAENFFTKADFFVPDGIAPDSAEAQIYLDAMESAEASYAILREQGLLPAHARHVLPMAINLGLLGAVDFRAFFHMIILRRCHIFQSSLWTPLIELMRKEVFEKVDQALDPLFGLQPCDLTGRCLSDFEQGLRQAGTDPHASCPRWREMQASKGARTCCEESCPDCLRAAELEKRSAIRQLDRQ